MGRDTNTQLISGIIDPMCGGLSYSYTNPQTGEITTRKVYFPIPHAQIPVITPEGVQLMQWGRRKGEDEEYDAPQTGWARLENLESPFWQKYKPSLILIPALEFCEKPEGFKKSAWYPPMRPGTFLEGLILSQQGKPFVYVVTHEPQQIFRDIDRVPVIVNAEFEVQEPLECAFEEQLAPKAASKKSKKHDESQLGLFDKGGPEGS